MSNTSQTDCLTCDTGFLEAPRYFPRQLITSTEMTLEQKYLRDKVRRHNRFLHGWGVVCGAMVCLTPDVNATGATPSTSPAAWKVAVNPGYILGPYGDEILIDCQRIVDLRTTGVAAACGEPGGELLDPWCTPVFVQQRKSPIYVAVKYKEIMTRPVRVQPVGCGCDDTQCEYSRWRDGYEIGILTDYPDCNAKPPSRDDLLTGALANCPDCPADPWVVLARVDLDDKGTILAIDNCSCRRMVVSFNQFWWQCAGGGATIANINGTAVSQAQPYPLQQGQQVTVNISGSNFQSGAQVSLGSDVAVTQITISPDGKSVAVNVDTTKATVGSHILVIANPDCSVATAPITITAAPRPAPAPQPKPAPAPTPTPKPAPAAEQPGGPAAPSGGTETSDTSPQDTGESQPSKRRRAPK